MTKTTETTTTRHQALYRKYRPTVFGDMIGQEHITKILTNQIAKNAIGHAYLFCGSRGTGKTSAAKIFARAVNCLRADAPCGKCEACVALSQATNMDVLEIDAASNNGVDEVRILRENIKFAPTVGKYKVYIIDEVHMLSNSAFNALLKTLEEPPTHAIFVLATTEVHKLPATILSRCMRFDFRLVDRATMARHLTKIFGLEKQTVDKDAIDYIAMRAEGSVRDSLSIADSCLSANGLTLEQVLGVLGSTDRVQTLKVLQAINSGNLGEVLQSVENLAQSGTSFGQLAKDVCKLARDILVAKTVTDFGSLLNESKETLALLQDNASIFGTEFLIGTISTFSAIDGDLRYSIGPRLVFETAALSACVRLHADLASITDRISRLEEYIKSSGQAAEGSLQLPSLPSSSGNLQPVVGSVGVQTTQAQSTPQSALKVKPQDAMSVWGKLATWMRGNSTPSNFNLLASHTSVNIVDGVLSVNVSQSRVAEFEAIVDIIQTAIGSIGFDLSFRVVTMSNSVDIDSELARLKDLMGDTPVNIKK